MCLEKHLSWAKSSVWAKPALAHQIFALGLHHSLLQEVTLVGLHMALLEGDGWDGERRLSGSSGDREVEGVELRRKA